MYRCICDHRQGNRWIQTGICHPDESEYQRTTDTKTVSSDQICTSAICDHSGSPDPVSFTESVSETVYSSTCIDYDDFLCAVCDFHPPIPFHVKGKQNQHYHERGNLKYLKVHCSVDFSYCFTTVISPGLHFPDSLQERISQLPEESESGD